MKKFIFVSGGVVSGLGKGITAASLGCLLKHRGLRVSAMKLDPYLNIDPGTISPQEHGEVFVCADGSETDLDLGHYERFMDVDMNRFSNVTSGKIYARVLDKERKGVYLGQTVQVVPHITDEIKASIYQCAEESQADLLICEIGGTIGDMESLPFLEAIRQIAQEQGREACVFLHVVLIPTLQGSGEQKSKPAQHSVQQLQSYGIFCDILIARSDEPLQEEVRRKLSLFCNLEEDYVIENQTLSSLYEVPAMLQKQQLDSLVLRKLKLNAPMAQLSLWNKAVQNMEEADEEVTIALVGKYNQVQDAYLSIVEALRHAAMKCAVKLHLHWIDAETLTPQNIAEKLNDCHGLLIPGGFGERGVEGKILAANYARIQGLPFLGICLGMQVAAIAFARFVLGYQDAHSQEFNQDSTHHIIHYMQEQEDMDKGASMRLGSHEIQLAPASRLAKLYQTTRIEERHRHRLEFNRTYAAAFEAKGMKLCATSQEGEHIEAFSYEKHEFYVAVQYHPEFKSRPNKAHPLFVGFLHHAHTYKHHQHLPTDGK